MLVTSADQAVSNFWRRLKNSPHSNSQRALQQYYQYLQFPLSIGCVQCALTRHVRSQMLKEKKTSACFCCPLQWSRLMNVENHNVEVQICDFGTNSS